MFFLAESFKEKAAISLYLLNKLSLIDYLVITFSGKVGYKI